MDAKRTAYTRRDTDPDWDSYRTGAMAYTLAIKLLQHPGRFGSALTNTGSLPIVERSSRDAWWGAMPQDDMTLTGRNVLGQLLTTLRDLLGQEQDPVRAAGRLLAMADTTRLTVAGSPAVPAPARR